MKSQEPNPALEYVILLLKNKELIIKATLAAMLVAAIVSLFLPPVYVAETRIIPPATSGSSVASSIAAQMGAMGLPAAGVGVKTVSDLYVALLRSKPVLDHVSERMNLSARYGVSSKEEIRRSLAGRVKIFDDKRSGIISISFMDKDPKDAAQISDAFVEGLQRLNNTLAVTEAAQRRLFFEEQLKRAKEQLIASEEAMKTFQRRSGTIKIDDEVKATIETVAKMRAMLSAKEVELNVMRSYATAQNPDFQRLQEEVSALRGEIYKFESKPRGPEDNPIPSVNSISSLGTEYLRRMREFKYSETLYEILMKQYGIAKLDESRDAAIIQVVERAEVPEKRIKPQRRMIVVRTGLLVFLSLVMLVLGRDYLGAKLQKPEVKSDLARIAEFLDFSKLAHDFRLDKAWNVLNSLFARKAR